MMKNASNVNFFAKIFAQSAQKTYLCHAKAQMAELVDALVSNTSGFTSMPVRSRLWVQNKVDSQLIINLIFCLRSIIAVAGDVNVWLIGAYWSN